MCSFMLAAAESSSHDGGGAFAGFLIICGLVWLVYALCKPRGFTATHRGTTTLRPH